MSHDIIIMHCAHIKSHHICLVGCVMMKMHEGWEEIRKCVIAITFTHIVGFNVILILSQCVCNKLYDGLRAFPKFKNRGKIEFPRTDVYIPKTHVVEIFHMLSTWFLTFSISIIFNLILGEKKLESVKLTSVQHKLDTIKKFLSAITNEMLFNC